MRLRTRIVDDYAASTRRVREYAGLLRGAEGPVAPVQTIELALALCLLRLKLLALAIELLAA